MAKCKISFDHFTREQIEELSVQLAVLSKRDTEFPDASALTGEEKLAIVQNGANALASMSAVANVVLQKLLEQVYPGHLDDLGVYVNTTEYWDSQVGFRPDAGTIIIYTDRDTVSGKNVSGIKIGDGTTTVQSLPFTDDKIALDLLLHKSNDTIHITAEERASWNAKSDFSGNYNDLTNKPHVPKYLYELLTDASHRTVSDTEKSYWNSKYEKPSTGIPKTDLSAEVQDTLYKADNAVLYTEQALGESQKSQARTNIGAGTYSLPDGGMPKNDLSADVRSSLSKADTAIQSHQELKTINGQTLVGTGNIDVATIVSGTTDYWNSRIGYVPDANTIIIYTDKDTVNGVKVPGIKIGSGNGYVQDLSFVGDEIAGDLMSHINDHNIHITALERAKWNHKLDLDETNGEIYNETIIFIR